MAYVITQHCCNDAACVAACPVNSIHPTPEEPDFDTAEMLYINPATCVDCGLCARECPTGAIAYEDDLPSSAQVFRELNAQYYTAESGRDRTFVAGRNHRKPLDPNELATLRVAIVGAGPSGAFAAAELLKLADAKVDMFERLPTAGGLFRYGIAPDHQETKAAAKVLTDLAGNAKFRLFLGVDVGRTLGHDDLKSRYHAVIYAVGASGEPRLGIDGEDLPGVYSAGEFFRWYNGDPNLADRTFELSQERAVIIGNGNVAFDVARVLLSRVEDLARTDIAEHALQALRASQVREVLIVSRGGIGGGAFSVGELIGLINTPGLDVRIDEGELQGQAEQAAMHGDPISTFKVKLLRGLSTQAGGRRTAALRFFSTPVAVLGENVVNGIRLERTIGSQRADGPSAGDVASTSVVDVKCGLIIRAIGFRADPIPQSPADASPPPSPSDAGRVLNLTSGEAIRGVYTVGWAKRGASGGIGRNKRCAAETVASLLADAVAAELPEPVLEDDIGTLLGDNPGVEGWLVLEAYERAAGVALGRPRLKVVEGERMLSVAFRNRA